MAKSQSEPSNDREMTLDEKIIHAYQTSSLSLQDIARVYNADINHVLIITGNDDLATVHVSGDMIDQQEAGPHAQMNYGEDVPTPITLN